MNQPKCIIWGIYVSVEGDPTGQKYIFNSPRAGGKYTVGHKMYIRASENRLNLNDKEKVRLSGYIAKQNLLDKIPPLDFIMKDTKELEKLPPIPDPAERAYLLLERFVKQTASIGYFFDGIDYFEAFRYTFPEYHEKFKNIDPELKERYYSYPPYYALSYCETEAEMRYLLNYLKELSFIDYGDEGQNSFQVTVKGFEKIDKLSKIADSKTAFIAMWLHPSMDKIKKNIETAIQKSGYNSLRIDDKEHNNKIDDEILNEIKKARFMVCDLTSKKGNPRGSVYFEAGYAMGRDMPIVWTCDKGLKEEIPFDIRQYNCLFWETNKMDDFVRKLQQRIENTVGKGPVQGV